MANFFGTNLVTIDGSEIYTGQTTCGTSAIQLTSSSDVTNLRYGIFLVAKDSASYYVNTQGGSPEVTTSNGTKVSANNPLFIPITDATVIRIICGGASKVMSWIAM